MIGDNLKAARISAAVAQALIELEGMKSDNRSRERQDLGHSYGESEFFSMAEELEQKVQSIIKFGE